LDLKVTDRILSYHEEKEQFKISCLDTGAEASMAGSAAAEEEEDEEDEDTD
jgi:hypothetical protein